MCAGGLNSPPAAPTCGQLDSGCRMGESRGAVTALSLLVTASRGLLPLVEAELAALGAKTVRPTPDGLRVRGPLEFAYRVCMWSRCASRVVAHLHDAAIDGPEALYEAARALAWEDHLGPDDTLAVDVVTHGEVVTHSRYAAQRIKDGIVDRMRERFGRRPSVDLAAPTVRIRAHVRGRGCSFGIDLAGEPLHRRGWRHAQGTAPLKETLAAGLLLRADWPARAAAGDPLVDPMCGAGTIAIEAACIAADLAPGRLRERFGFLGWRGHDAQAWARVQEEARSRAQIGLARPGPDIDAADADEEAILRARGNAAAAGVGDRVEVHVADMRALPFPDASFDGVVSSFAIDHLSRDDRRRALAEAARVLRADGHLLVMNLAVDHWVRVALPTPPGHGYFGHQQDSARWRHDLDEAGFELVEEGRRPGTVFFLAARRAR